MMSKKTRRLYNRMQTGIRMKEAENEKLLSKRKRLDEDECRFGDDNGSDLLAKTVKTNKSEKGANVSDARLGGRNRRK